MRKAAVMLVTLCGLDSVRADGVTSAVTPNARLVGRAGTGVVAVDNGAALSQNPAGLARRSDLRAQLEILTRSDLARFRTAEVPRAQAVENLAGSALGFSASAQAGLGDRIVIGAAATRPPAVSYVWSDPGGRPFTGDLSENNPHRYAAPRFELSRHGVEVGAALRLEPWLAVGLTLSAQVIELVQHRTLWGGTATAVDFTALNPGFDMLFSASGRDPFVAGATLGLIVAPDDAPLEVGASVTWSDQAHLAGSASLSASRNSDPLTGAPLTQAEVAADARSELSLPLPRVFRMGVRLVIGRASLELAGESFVYPRGNPAWSVRGISLRRNDAAADLQAVPLATSFADHLGFRTALDADIVRGLRASLGYAFTQAAVPRDWLTPAFPDLDAHTAALGVELATEGAVITLGLSHSLRAARSVGADEARVRVAHPLIHGDYAAAAGRYAGSATTVAIGLELSFDPAP